MESKKKSKTRLSNVQYFNSLFTSSFSLLSGDNTGVAVYPVSHVNSSSDIHSKEIIFGGVMQR